MLLMLLSASWAWVRWDEDSYKKFLLSLYLSLSVCLCLSFLFAFSLYISVYISSCLSICLYFFFPCLFESFSMHIYHMVFLTSHRSLVFSSGNGAIMCALCSKESRGPRYAGAGKRSKSCVDRYSHYTSVLFYIFDFISILFTKHTYVLTHPFPSCLRW